MHPLRGKENAPAPSVTTLPGMTALVNPLLAKALPPISVTVVGMEMEESERQTPKAFVPMTSKPSCNVTLERAKQLSKAKNGICLREAGISTDTRFLQPLKAPSPISVRLFGRVILLMEQY